MLLRPLQPNEIAIQEDLSVARISQIINSTIETMIENSKKYKNQLDRNYFLMHYLNWYKTVNFWSLFYYYFIYCKKLTDEYTVSCVHF